MQGLLLPRSVKNGENCTLVPGCSTVFALRVHQEHLCTERPVCGVAPKELHWQHGWGIDGASRGDAWGMWRLVQRCRGERSNVMNWGIQGGVKSMGHVAPRAALPWHTAQLPRAHVVLPVLPHERLDLFLDGAHALLECSMTVR